VSDLVSGLYTTIAILAALIHQARTGEGQAIDMALFDCQAAALANQATNFLAGQMLPGRLGNAHPNIVPYQVFATKDGFLILGVANDGQFRRFSEVAGVAHLASDARFATNAARVEHREVLVDLLKPMFLQFTTHEWIDQLESANVPCGPINRVDEVFSDPQAIARQLTVAMPHSMAGTINLVASPIRLAKTPPEYRLAPPLLGEHTNEILTDVLGKTEAQIQELRRRSLI